MVMRICLIILLLLLPSGLYPQGNDTDAETDTSILSRRNIAVATVSVGLTAFFATAYYSWWKDDSRSFSFYSSSWLNEPGEYGIDKISHFYTSYLSYRLQKDLLLWGGYSEFSSTMVSAILTFLAGLAVEIGDGFSTHGFDYKDLAFNIGGLAYGIAQDQFRVLNHFKFKWSYYPTGSLRLPPRLTRDYDGHIYWLTIDVHNLFHRSIGKFIPEFIQPAIGYSIGGDSSRREYIFGLDFNLMPLFRNTGETVKLIGNAVDMIRLPAPGVKYSPSVKPEYRILLVN